jgi:hypothetical protein
LPLESRDPFKLLPAERVSDFARFRDRLEADSGSFVLMVQGFNTSSSMGRLPLNVLPTFDQFLREVTAELIRDKIAAERKKGLLMEGLALIDHAPHPDPTPPTPVSFAARVDTALIQQVFHVAQGEWEANMQHRRHQDDSLATSLRSGKELARTCQDACERPSPPQAKFF